MVTGVPMCCVLIGKPGINVSTKFVYGNLHLDEVTEHPDIDGMVEAIRNHDLYGITDRMGNVLESVTCPAYPVIDEIKGMYTDVARLEAPIEVHLCPSRYGYGNSRFRIDASRVSSWW